MSARDTVLRLLTTGASRRISFSFSTAGGRTVTVNESTFDRVALAITSITPPQVHLVIGTSRAGTSAEYFASANPARGIAQPNTLLVPPVIGRETESLILHESVHASFDLTRSPLDVAHEEAAAYIVSYVYYRRTGMSPSRTGRPGIAAAARPIADAVVRRQAITAPQIAALVAAISGHPVYAPSSAGSYLHDG